MNLNIIATGAFCPIPRVDLFDGPMVELGPFGPENLPRWTRPDSYMGAEWPDYFIFLGQNRDSNALDRSNFIRALELIGGESDTVLVLHEGHWAVGWVEWIAIHESDESALEKADEIAAALSEYPVVDESHYSELEYTEAADLWESLPVRERVEYCRDAGVSIFAARRSTIPEDDGTICQTLRGD